MGKQVLLIYHFVKPTCLICNVYVAVNKEFNIKRHYDVKHTNFSKFTVKARKAKEFNIKRHYDTKHTSFSKFTV